jgi:hypothetical protein
MVIFQYSNFAKFSLKDKTIIKFNNIFIILVI